MAALAAADKLISGKLRPSGLDENVKVAPYGFVPTGDGELTGNDDQYASQQQAVQGM